MSTSAKALGKIFGLQCPCNYFEKWFTSCVVLYLFFFFFFNKEPFMLFVVCLIHEFYIFYIEINY